MLDPQCPVVYSKVPTLIGRVRSHVIGRSPAFGHTPASVSPYVSLIGRTLPASGHFQCQRPMHSVRLCLFCVGRRWHRRTVRTLRADTPSVEFLHQVDPHQLQLHLLCKCANTTKCTPPCVCVLAFHNHFPKDVSHSILPRHSILATMQS